MASKIKVDQLEGSTGTSVTIPTGHTFTVTDNLTVSSGGTGLASFAAGDILYATGSTTLAKLPKGTAEQVLAMNSGATAPDWGSVDLTVLPTITVAKGGTNLSSFAAGDVLYATGSTTLAKLAKGSAAEVLTMNAGATAPEWAAAAGGGKIVQITNTTSTTAFTTTSTSDVASNCSGAITPTSSSNKIIVTASYGMQSYDNSGNCNRVHMRVYRDIGGAGFLNSIQAGSINFGHCRTESDTQERAQYGWPTICFLDSPATTSAVTYTVYASVSSAYNLALGYGSQLQTMLLMETDES